MKHFTGNPLEWLMMRPPTVQASLARPRLFPKTTLLRLQAPEQERLCFALLPGCGEFATRVNIPLQTWDNRGMIKP